MAETIRIEVVDVSGAGTGTAATAQGTNAGTATTGSGGAQGGAWTSNYNFNQANSPSRQANDRPRTRRQRDDGVPPLGGRGWAHYLNKEMPYGSFAINQMQWRKENQMGWARDLLGLPDRLERSLIKAQHNSWGKDPVAFEQLQKITQEYRMERFQGVVEKLGDGIVGMAQMAFRPYRGISNETITFGQNIKAAGNTVAGFALMLGGPLLAGAVKAFSVMLGTGAEVIGIAQGKLTEEAGRVRGFSPHLRMQGIVAGLREMQTDMEIARKFGGQMARQEDMSSRRESAYRLLTTKLAATMTKPFDQMNEAWTSTLEALAGQRGAMDALANAAAALPGIGDWFKKDADRRNAEFKEKQNMKDIESGKKLCEDVLGIILPGEIGLGPGGVHRPPKKQQVQKVMHQAVFGGGNDDDLGIAIKLK